MTHQKLDEKELSPFEQFVADEIKKNGKEPDWKRRCLELKQRAEFLESEDFILREERNKLQSELAELKTKNFQLEVDIDQIKDPSYCPICESCGVVGCCSLQRCKFAPTDNEIINSLNEQNAGLREDLKNQKEELLEAREVIGFYASEPNWTAQFRNGKLDTIFGNALEEQSNTILKIGGKRAREFQKKFGVGNA